MITVTSPSMPRIIYAVDCTDPFGDPCWSVTAYDITGYRNQGVAVLEMDVTWKASERDVTREIPYKFQQDLKEIVIKTRGDYLDYFKKVTDKKRYLDEKEKLEKAVEKLVEDKKSTTEEATENTTKESS